MHLRTDQKDEEDMQGKERKRKNYYSVKSRAVYGSIEWLFVT